MMSFVKRAVQAEIDAPRIENKIYKNLQSLEQNRFDIQPKNCKLPFVKAF